MKNNVLIYHSCPFAFFGKLQYKSLAMFAYDGTRSYTVLDAYRSGRLDEACALSGFERLCLGLYSGQWDDPCVKGMRHGDFMEKINGFIDVGEFSDLVLLNGPTNGREPLESEFWGAYVKWKASGGAPISETGITGDMMFHEYILLFALVEIMAKGGGVVHNIWEDPLQHKLDYIKGAKVKHYYFHKLRPGPGPGYYAQDGKGHLVDYSPSQQFYYCTDIRNNNPATRIAPKTRDFVFYMTDTIKERTTRPQIIDNMLRFADNKKTKGDKALFKYSTVRDSHKKRSSKRINYNEYLGLIKSASLTLIIPSYDTACFSLRRFFEAATSGCLPLILGTCNYKAGFNFDKEMIGIVENHLLVTMDDLKNLGDAIEKTKNQTTMLLDKIMRTKYMKKYHDPLFYKRYMDKMFGNYDAGAVVTKNMNQ